nr:small heat shock protein [Endomyzostoma scotia]
MALTPFERIFQISRPNHNDSFGMVDFRSRMDREMRDIEMQMNEASSRMQRLISLPDFGQQQSRRGWGDIQMPAVTDNWRVDSPTFVEENGQRKMKLNFDMGHFTPEEITVKTKDNNLIVQAKHEEKSDSGHVFREYNKMYQLPEGVKLDEMKSFLTQNGSLCVEAPVPLPVLLPEANEKTIAIQHQ